MGRCLVFSEDEFKENFHVLNLHGIGTGSNPFQSMPISTNPVPIPGQSETTLSPRNLGTSAPCWLIISLLGDEIHATQSALNANLTQSRAGANPVTIQCQFSIPSKNTILTILANSHQSRTISINNLCTSPYRESNVIQFLPIQANPVPIRGESDASPRSTFPSKMNSLNSQNRSIPANPMPILANPMPFLGHFWGPFV